MKWLRDFIKQWEVLKTEYLLLVIVFFITDIIGVYQFFYNVCAYSYDIVLGISKSVHDERIESAKIVISKLTMFGLVLLLIIKPEKRQKRS